VEAPKVRRNWLAKAALATVALSVPMTAGVAGSAQAATTARHLSFNEKVATQVKRYEGVPYRYGGTSPAGFDCSGLAQYVYRYFGKKIQRTAEAQFLEFRRISKKKAWGGDLVFFHVDSNPNSYVYHVGIYEGGNDMVAATTTGSDVQWQNFSWAGDTVTFGTLTH
jgi:cell wall-associated NlpC family hydrolase